MERLSTLKKDWTALASMYSTDKSKIGEFWQEIVIHYSSPKRHYHNLEHISNMLTQSQKHADNLKDPETVKLAIWYHDIIYNALRNDNEEKSTILASSRLKELYVPKQQIQKCHNLILATKTHQTDNTDSDFDYLLDFDLSILGSPWPSYRTYIENIRKEYAVYPDLIYKPGRKKVLKKFLEKDRIYKTDFYFDTFEGRARENIARELEGL